MKANLLKTAALFLASGSLLHAQNVTNNLTAFDRVSISRSVNIIVKQGSSFSISAPDDQTLNDVQYRQNGNNIIFAGISSQPVTVTTDNLKQVDIAGNGTISTDGVFKAADIEFNISGNGKTNMNLDAGKLDFNVSGNCTGTLSGKANEVELNISGRLDLHADSMVISKCTASVSGSAYFKGDVRDELNTFISGKGNIFYVTRPAVVNTNNSGITRIGDATSTDKSSDTTKIHLGGLDGPKVWIITSDHDEINFERDKPAKSKFHWAGLELGFDYYVDKDFNFDVPDGYEYLGLRQGKSVVTNLNLFGGAVKFANRHLMLGSGFGFSFINYRFTTQDKILTPNADSVTYTYTGDKGFGKYKLAVQYISVPLLLQFNSSKMNANNFFISAGIVANYKIGAHTKLKEAGDKTKFYDEFNLNPWKMDLRAAIGYRNLNVFATYSLSGLFKEGKGPELHPVSAGITLGGW